jgi:hypothetical protein
MRIATLSGVAALAALAGACTTDSYGHAPYYGPSQGYAYPPGYRATGPYNAPPPYGYRTPYGYPYGGAGQGPSITLSILQG